MKITPPPFVESAQLSRLQHILNAACEELRIADTSATRHVREFLGRHLIILGDDEGHDDEMLLNLLLERARLLGFEPDPIVAAERVRRLIDKI